MRQEMVPKQLRKKLTDGDNGDGVKADFAAAIMGTAEPVVLRKEDKKRGEDGADMSHQN